ncbi:2Fe-2S iron-sulfur cluster binding domain-containing protein [Spongiibacter nanhainus]|uniref:2Fe-2S iron-sulfur cluster binding domain-containing protein n=1 Tax=Spongiibacter nanhainus TaxID=2794344 RepID=A0A7T4UPC5_9GAMM|nr:2Fe-2S iron-sulfur cluster-binding protein [Spongiibacter nanhainus]QQD16898.1 2Fe-2S iron-sulfur cluster binding domain-containing protein [Spongiibacter nanhainus]
MPTIKFVTHDGNEQEVEAESGTTVMQAAMDNGIDAILAECGGACSCATCHCYVDEAWTDRMPEADEIEKDMLDCVLEPQDNSRLSCQITVTDDLDGIVIRLPESQY